MFMKIIEWKIGCENNFSVSFGTAGKFMNAYLPDDLYKMILRTYSDHEIDENWKSLLMMVDIFKSCSNMIAEKLNFKIDKIEQNNTVEYLTRQRNSGTLAQ